MPSASSHSSTDFCDIVVRVRYAETDQMGMVYYANYFVYAEIGRVEYMRERGVNYRQMETDGDTFIPVTECQCRYVRPARYDDLLRIRTRVAEVRRRTVRFAFEILRDPEGELLASGETMHVICDGKGRPKTLPEQYRRVFQNGPAAAPAKRRHETAG